MPYADLPGFPLLPGLRHDLFRHVFARFVLVIQLLAPLAILRQGFYRYNWSSSVAEEVEDPSFARFVGRDLGRIPRARFPLKIYMGSWASFLSHLGACSPKSSVLGPGGSHGNGTRKRLIQGPPCHRLP